MPQALLIDHDAAVNLGNWAYNAGVGADPRNRVFRTVSQGIKYDPEVRVISRNQNAAVDFEQTLKCIGMHHAPGSMAFCSLTCAAERGGYLPLDVPACPLHRPCGHAPVQDRCCWAWVLSSRACAKFGARMWSWLRILHAPLTLRCATGTLHPGVGAGAGMASARDGA